MELYTVERLRDRIAEALDEAEVFVTDLTGTHDHFKAVVVSPSFEGKTRVAQHQLVYRALGSDVGGAIHALALETYTPDQWKAKTA